METRTEKSTTLRIAVAQIELRPGDKQANAERALAAIREAAARGAQLLVLPELCSTGYALQSRAQVESLAEPLDGPVISVWKSMAAEHALYLVAGFAEADGPRCFNSAVLVGPEGLVGVYRKTHLFHRENDLFDPGDLGFPVFETDVGRIGMQICYDLRFPEAMRTQALRGADVVCVPTAWVVPEGRETDERGLSMQAYCAMAQASMNGVAVACSDCVGPWNEKRSFLGGSLVAGSDGWLLAGPAGRSEESVLMASIELDTVRASRQKNEYNHVLRDRRPAAYQLG